MIFQSGLNGAHRSGVFNRVFRSGLKSNLRRHPGISRMICCVLLSMLFIGFSTPIYSQQGATVVLLLVDSTLAPQLGALYSIFKQDLAYEGFVVSEEIMNSNTEPPEIRQIIQQYYSSPITLSGVILIGNLKAPYVIVKTGEYADPNALKLWISLDAADMYYGDMDGEWDHLMANDFKDIVDHPPSNVAELYQEASCNTFINEYIVDFDKEKVWDYQTVQNKSQYALEIWVSRIMGHNLAISGKTEIDILNDYFNWNHTFRTGGYKIPETCYMLNAAGSGCNDQGMDYSNIFDEVITAGDVSKQSYLPYLQEESGSKLFYATIHSCPGWHQFLDGTLLTTNELLKIKKTGVFYMLNCCEGCRWDEYIMNPADPNYLGGVYVFDKSDDGGGVGVAAMGFTGVGGYNNLNYFTECYNDFPFATYGDMYVYWFNHNLQINFSPTNYVFLGDPTIGPDTPIEGPTVVSDSPEQIKEYNLSQNYPNPFNPSTNIVFDLQKESRVSLVIYDLAGNKVWEMPNNGEVMSPGQYTYQWDGTNMDNVQVASGLYLIRLIASGYNQTRKAVFMK